MESREIKRRTKKLIKEFDIREVNYESLKKVIGRLGYTVVEFNHILNDGDVAALVSALNLSDKIACSRGFTYADRNYRIVFVHEDLSESEKLLVLSHETGHICLDHMAMASEIGRDVREEYEANEFSHFLLNRGKLDKSRSWLYRHKLIVILIVAGIAAAITVGAAVSRAGADDKYYGEYYITKTGTKYHKKDCKYLQGKTKIRRMTTEEYESGEYEPCSVCIGED